MKNLTFLYAFIFDKPGILFQNILKNLNKHVIFYIFMRQHIISFTVLINLSSGLFSLPAAAIDNQNQTRNPLFVKQIRKEQAGVLISRPDPLDEKIRDIIKTNNIFSLADYGQWLKAHIHYKNDEGKDCWSLPEDTLAKGWGDCEDLAFLNQAVLCVLGYEPRVLCVLRMFCSHAICVFQENGYYQIVDNTTFKHTPARSFDELLHYLFIVYNCASIGELDLQAKEYQVLFRRKDILFQ